jgi:hypothetical protein
MRAQNYERVREEDRVVEERLAGEQRQPDERALRVHPEHDAADLADADRPALLDADRAARLDQLLARRRGHLALDVGRDPLRLLVPVQEQPARALGDVAADQQDPEAHRGGETEAEAPADDARAGDEPADDQVDGAAHARGDQLFDRGTRSARCPPPGHAPRM